MKKFWNFRNSTEKSAELLLYGVISDTSWWDDEVTPKQFAEDLKALGDIDELTVRINSPGGDVFAGQTIYSLIKAHKAKVTVCVDGLAASIASVIAMSGDTVIMPKNAMLMIHNPWAWAYGNANDFRKMADDLDKIRESLIAVYQDKTGMEREKIIEMLDAETWLTAAEAKEYGFADNVDEKRVAASVPMFVFGSSEDIFQKYASKHLEKFNTMQSQEEETPNQGSVFSLRKKRLALLAKR